MNALEPEIFQKFQQLDTDSKLRMLARLVGELEDAFDAEEWFQQVQLFHQELRNKYGEDYTVGVQSLLDEPRNDNLSK
jgi:DNA-binding GntR family transcriptional regulator